MYSTGPHRVPWHPPRPLTCPAWPPVRAYPLRRWPVIPQMRGQHTQTDPPEDPR